MQRHIIFTRIDGSVAIVTASRNWMQVVRNGGYPWFTGRGSIDRAIENRIKAGVPEGAARRHVRACAFGGCSTGEAMEIIRDNAMDIDNGVLSLTAFAPEVCDAQRFRGLDRWFRNAWRRSQNGGPISIELEAARMIQAQRIRDAVTRWNAGAERHNEISLLAGRITNGPATIQIDKPRLRSMIEIARTPDELKAVWPDDLPTVA